MTGRDPKQGNRRSIGFTSILLPVAKRVNTDPHRFCEASLRQANESAERSDICAGLELACDQTLSNSRRHRPSKLLCGQFRNVRHRNYSMEER